MHVFASLTKASNSSLLTAKSTSGNWLEVTFIACEALSLRCQKLTPIKVFKVLCFWSAACAIQLPHNIAGYPRRLLRWNIFTITRTQSIQTLVKDYIKLKCCYTPVVSHPGLPSQPFPRADIIAPVKHIWTMTDVFGDGCLYSTNHSLIRSWALIA